MAKSSITSKHGGLATDTNKKTNSNSSIIAKHGGVVTSAKTTKKASITTANTTNGTTSTFSSQNSGGTHFTKTTQHTNEIYQKAVTPLLEKVENNKTLTDAETTKLSDIALQAKNDTAISQEHRDYYANIYSYIKEKTSAYSEMQKAKSELEKIKNSPDNNIVANTLDKVLYGTSNKDTEKYAEENYYKKAITYYAYQGYDTEEKIKTKLKKIKNQYSILSHKLDAEGLSDKEAAEYNELKDMYDTFNYALYGSKNAIAKGLISGVKKIGVDFLSMVGDTGDAVINGVSNFLGHGDIVDSTSQLKSKSQELSEDMYAGNYQLTGSKKVADILNSASNSIVSAVASTIPTVAVSLACPPAGAVTLGTQTASTALKISNYISNLAKNPAFWTSFSVQLGAEYNALVEKGIPKSIALVLSLPITGINSLIEISGGVENLPGTLSKIPTGKEKLVEYLLSSLEEGGEEILQATTSEIYGRLASGDFDFSKENVSSFSKEALTEGVGGFIGGLFLGGSQMAFSEIINYNTNAQYSNLGKFVKMFSDTVTLRDIEEYAKTSDNETIRAIIRSKADVTKLSDVSVGMIYSYMCSDIDYAINNTKTKESATEGLKTMTAQFDEGSPIIEGVIIPQYVEKMRSLEATNNDIILGIADATGITARLTQEGDIVTKPEAEINTDTTDTESETVISEDEQTQIIDGAEVDGEEIEAPKVEGTDDIVSKSNDTTENGDTATDKSTVANDNNDGNIFHSEPDESIEKTKYRITEAAKKYDSSLTVVFVDEIHDKNGNVDEGANGKYVRKTNTLYLKKGIPSSVAYVELYKHEFMHYLEKSKSYNAFKNFVLNTSSTFESYVKFVIDNKLRTLSDKIERTPDTAKRQKLIDEFNSIYEKVMGEKFEFRRDNYFSIDFNWGRKEQYRNSSRSVFISVLEDIYQKYGYESEEVPYEIVADFFATCMLKGENGRAEIINYLRDGMNELPSGENNLEEELNILEELSRKEPGLLQKIKEFFAELIKKIKGEPKFRSLESDLKYLDNYIEKLINSKDVKNPTEKTGGVRYSIDSNFSREFDKAISNDDYYKNNSVVVGKIPNIFRKYGFDVDKPMTITPKHLKDITHKKVEGVKKYHGLTKENIINAVEQLESPALIIKSPTNDNVLIAFTTETDSDNIPIAIYVSKSGKAYINAIETETNHILSIYGRDNTVNFINTAINENRVIEGNKKRADTLQNILGIMLSLPDNILSIDSTVSIPTSTEKSNKNFSTNESQGKFSRGDFLENLRYNPERYMRWLLRKYGVPSGQAYIEDFTPRLNEIVKIYNKGGAENIAEAEYKLNELSMDMAESVPGKITDWSQEIIDFVKRTKVYISETQRSEILSKYKTIRTYERETGIKITDDAYNSLDQQWQEWCEEYPGYFKSDVNEGDQINELADVIYSAKKDFEDRDDSLLATEIASEISLAILNSGKMAEKRRINAAEKRGLSKGLQILDEYKAKEEVKKKARETQKNKIEIRDKTIKLINSFERKLTKPTQNSHIPTSLVRACIDALQMIRDNPIDFDDTKILGKYYNRLEKLNQDIQNETDDNIRKELQEKYDELYKRAIDVTSKFNKISVELEKLKTNSNYDTDYTQDVIDMLVNLQVTVNDTAPQNYTEHQYRVIYNTFSALNTLIRNEDKLTGQKDRENVSEISNKFIREIRGSVGKFKIGEKYFTTQMRPETFFKRISGFVDNSVGQFLYDMLNKGQKQAMSYKMRAQNIFDEVLSGKENFNKARALQSTKEKDLVDSGLVDENGDKIFVTKAMRLSLLMHSFNEQNSKHLLSGIKIPDIKKYYKDGMGVAKEYTTTGYVDDVLNWQLNLAKSLSDYEAKWIVALQEYYYKFSSSHINETTFKLYGFEKAVNENYFPIKTSDSFTNKPIDALKLDATIEGAGWLKERVNASNPMYLIDAIEQVNSDIDKHSNFYGMAVPLRNFNKVYNYVAPGYTTSVKDEIMKQYPEDGKKYIEKLITDLNGAVGKQSSVFDMLKGRYAQAVLTFNLPVSIKQAASYPTAAATLGWKPLIKAIAYIEKDNGQKGFVLSRAETEIIKKYTPLLWYRMQGNIDSEIGDIKEKTSAGDKLAKKAPNLFNWIQKIDGATVGRLWYASKFYVEDNYNLEKGSKAYYQKVAEIFDKTVEQTQPNYTAMQRPDVLRSDNALIRAMTMFYTQRLQNTNILLEAVMNLSAKQKALEAGKSPQNIKAFKEAKIQFGRAVSSQVVAAATLSAMTLLAGAILNSLNPFRDDDDELTKGSILAGLTDIMIDTLLGSFLFGSEIYEVITAVSGKGKWYGFQVPAIETLNNLISSIINTTKSTKEFINDWINGEGSLDDLSFEMAKDIKDLSINASQLLGVPSKNMEKVGLGIYYWVEDIINGEAFAQAVKDNKVNEFFGASIQSKKQKLNVIISAIESGDKEKSDKLIDEFLKENPDKDITNEIVKTYKNNASVQKEVKSISENSDKFQNLDTDDKKDATNDIKEYYATEKAFEARKIDPEIFDDLYTMFKKNKSRYKRQETKLIESGYTAKEIELGIDYARVRYMESLGVSAADYFAAKKYMSKKNADTDGSGGVSNKEKKFALRDNGYTPYQIKRIIDNK